MEEYKANEKIKNFSAQCYLIMFLNVCGFVVAIYFLVQGFQDPQKEELKELEGVINQWDQSFITLNQSSALVSSSQSSQIEMLKNFSENYKEKIKDFPKYTPLSFTLHQNFSNPVTSFKIQYKNSEEFNVSCLFSFEISNEKSISKFDLEIPIHMRKVYPANEKVCRNSGRGFWNRKLERCYYHYNTVQVCLLLDSNLNLSSYYEKGCDNKDYLNFYALTWQNSDNYTDVDHSVFIQLRSESDPYVYASYNSLTELSSSSTTYKTIGIVFLTISGVLTGFILIFWAVQRRHSKYLKMKRKNLNVI